MATKQRQKSKGKPGRHPTGNAPRGVILRVCVTEAEAGRLGDLARESRRTVSDYLVVAALGDRA